MAISSEDQTKLLKGVIGLFDAAAGKEINAQLENAVDNGLSIPEVLNILTTKTEFTDGVMGSASTSAEQAAVLAGNFGLTADGVEGSPATLAINHFEAGIDGGTEIGTLVYQAVVYLMQPELPAEFAETAQLLENKAAVAKAYNAEASSSDLATMQAVLDDPLITGSGPISQDDIDQVLANAGVGIPGSFTLTADTDIASANTFLAGLVFTPGGNDRINALQDEDELTGVGPNPTLNATLGNANDNGGTTITPTLNNIQTANLTFSGSDGSEGGAVRALDMQDASGLTAINIKRVSEAVNRAEVGNIQDATVDQLSLSNTNANDDGTVEFSYAAGVLSGENSVSMEINNVQLLNLNIGQNASGITGLGVAGQGYENVNLNSAGTASNSIGLLSLPMDTGTNGSVVIEGEADLNLSASNAIVGPDGEEAVVHLGGIDQTQGRLATVDASGMTGALTLNIGPGFVSTGKADTSGVDQDVTIIGSAADDTFYLNDLVQAGDSISGGEGADTLVAFQGGVLGSVTGVETVDVQLYNADVRLDMNQFPDTTTLNVRNISDDSNFNATDPGTDQVARFDNMSAAQAADMHIQHSTTGNGGIVDTTIDARLASVSGNDELLSVSIDEGVNSDKRFNFTVKTNQVGGNGVENVTIIDNDSESNSVELTSFATHKGTITIQGGIAGKFLNFDVDTAAAAGLETDLDEATIAAQEEGGDTYDAAEADDVMAAEAANGLQGLDLISTTGGTANGLGRQDVAALDTQVRVVAGTIDAAEAVGDIIVRVSSTAANTDGGQTITMGAGDDTVIFDDVSPSSTTRGTAGLTNADHVSGGDGVNTLVIDGNGTDIVIQQSEWDNVDGFQNLYLAGNGAGNKYFIQLDNDMIDANGENGDIVHISNDDGSIVTVNPDPNDGIVEGNVDRRVSNNDVRIDATTLSANNHFSYDGEEGTGSTVDRFVLNDANANGGNIIDGGEADISNNVDERDAAGNLVQAGAGIANNDVLEIRNTSTLTTSDLANIKNVGNIVINNDQATTQTLNLTLNNTVVDALVDAGHAATPSQTETLNITANDGQMTDPAGTDLTPIAASVLNINARDLNGAFGLNITGDQSFGGLDNIELTIAYGGAGHVINLGGAQDNPLTAEVEKDTIDINGLDINGSVAFYNDPLTPGGRVYVFTNSTGATTQHAIANFNNVALTLTDTDDNEVTAVQIEPPVGDPVFAISADQDSVDEGNSAVFSVTSANTEAGDTIGYTISGVDADDVDGGELTGTATVDADGNATISIGVAFDGVEEGQETLTVTLDGGASASVTVNDSVEPPVQPVPVTDDITAADGAEVFSLAEDYVGQFEITGFDITEDSIQFDLDPSDNGITTLDALNGFELADENIVAVQQNQITGSTFINLGIDEATGNAISLELIGVADPSTVAIEVI
ncbi:hypothetical protein SAMN05216326_11625 [Nitrosomonas marina]|uniref:Uncharacterized protein n=1 Tax=Nitrosomonas marina TaxID=917 RepID=A0A1I0CSN4_9PROT|nr:hypothetical protein [Nitrosomonas marina]SET22820.1 hypothetical protein SAMN05216326_11625 [Nitrosomonas marina]